MTDLRKELNEAVKFSVMTGLWIGIAFSSACNNETWWAFGGSMMALLCYRWAAYSFYRVKWALPVAESEVAL